MAEAVVLCPARHLRDGNATVVVDVRDMVVVLIPHRARPNPIPLSVPQDMKAHIRRRAAAVVEPRHELRGPVPVHVGHRDVAHALVALREELFVHERAVATRKDTKPRLIVVDELGGASYLSSQRTVSERRSK